MKVSRFFGLNHIQAELDFVDVDVDLDTPLFVDPYAIQIKENELALICADQIRSYFSEVLNALTNGNDQRAIELTSYLHEPQDTYLGVSRGQPQGRGVGRFQADQILMALRNSRAFQTGILTDLAEAELFVEGIARDKISDLTTNIIRGALIKYTSDECNLHGIPLNQDVASGPIWDHNNLRWHQEFVRLPIIDGKPVLLVPKSFVRWKLSINSQEFYNHFMINFLRDDHLRRMTPLVGFFRNGAPKLYKKEVVRSHPFSKDALAEFVQQHPEVLEHYKNLKGARGPLENEDFDQEFNEIQFAASLRITLRRIAPGMQTANRYHSFIYGLLTFLLYPDLINPVKEHEIHQGRKRVDIKFTNAAEIGFFRQMIVSPNTRAINIFIECKNYSRDLGNPELDQISGRFSPIRGKLGFIFCRELIDAEAMLERCRDTARDDRGFVIVLIDSDVEQLLEFVERGQRHRISDFLLQKFATLTD